MLGCYGVNGGKAGGSYHVLGRSPDGGTEPHPGMSDTVTVAGRLRWCASSPPAAAAGATR